VRTAAILCAAALAAFAPTSTARAQAEAADATRWNWRGAIAAGKTLEIKGVNGSVRAEAGTGSQVEVTAEKTARHDDPADVRIEVVEHDGNVTICAVYPGRGNSCEPGDGGHSSVRDNDVQVRFVARIPAGVVFHGRTVNGSVEASGLTAAVDLSTVNGGVEIETASGNASGTTVNGPVRATVRGQGREPLRFSTVNGSIDVTLASGLSADFSAETVNGSIQSDFPVTLQGRINPRHLSGRIGQGGRSLRLSTVNGGIRLHTAP
jgi:hypothetical protein